MPKSETVELKELHVFVPKPLYDAISAKAGENDRSLSAEIRRTLKKEYDGKSVKR